MDQKKLFELSDKSSYTTLSYAVFTVMYFIVDLQTSSWSNLYPRFQLSHSPYVSPETEENEEDDVTASLPHDNTDVTPLPKSTHSINNLDTSVLIVKFWLSTTLIICYINYPPLSLSDIGTDLRDSVALDSPPRSIIRHLPVSIIRLSAILDSPHSLIIRH